jgi:hypothetical protein
MIESPLLQEMLAKNTAQTMQKIILRVLIRRFGLVPADVVAAVRTIYDEPNLDELLGTAAVCANLEGFQQHLAESCLTLR